VGGLLPWKSDILRVEPCPRPEQKLADQTSLSAAFFFGWLPFRRLLFHWLLFHWLLSRWLFFARWLLFRLSRQTTERLASTVTVSALVSIGILLLSRPCHHHEFLCCFLRLNTVLIKYREQQLRIQHYVQRDTRRCITMEKAINRIHNEAWGRA